MSTIRYYHYTSKEKAEMIIKSTEIRPTITKEVKKGKRNDAFHGSGVYLTVLPPIPGYKEKILRNNWGPKSTNCFEKAEMFIEIHVPRDDPKINICSAKNNRDIHLYKGTLNLENYDWKSGIYEEVEDNTHDPKDSKKCKPKEGTPEMAQFQKRREEVGRKFAHFFFGMVWEDFYPSYAISPLFGIQILQPRSVEHSLQDRKIEEVVFGAWIGIITITHDIEGFEPLAEALINGNLPEKFQEWIYGHHPNSEYEKELIRRGFESINWMSLDEYVTQKTCSMFTATCNIVPSEEVKTLVSQVAILRGKASKLGTMFQMSTEEVDILRDLEFRLSKMEGFNLCDFCNSPTLKKCSKCRKGWFCNEGCQRTFWPYHKILCKKIPSK